MSIEDRFWAKVQVGDPEECWPWTAGTYRRGYGKFHLPGGTSITATRFALATVLGRPLTLEEAACHGCDNPPCCNPTPGGRHLFVGTYQVNSRDMVAKGRNVEQHLHGANNGRAKLTDGAVQSIRLQRLDGAEVSELAALHQVSLSTIRRITNNRSWVHLGAQQEAQTA